MPKRNLEISEDEEPVFGTPKRRKTNCNSRSTEFTHNSYTVGWICALPKEQTAATAMLEQRHADLPKPPNDHNAYTLGSMHKHNMVITCLPKGQLGTSSAGIAATHMMRTFPSIKFFLMVGIGGGIPPTVRLGDVVVSVPDGRFPGVVQWDYGKAKVGGKFERTMALKSPPQFLLAAVAKLETQHGIEGTKIPKYLDELKEKRPELASRYQRSDSHEDVLFKADYSHVNESRDCSAIPDKDDGDDEKSCQSCDRTMVVNRKPRDMKIHYGLIASGNKVIKDAIFRDKLNKDLGGKVLCVEMEAAGLMNNFPCIVIRGICDYADSHKNKDWQEHAAMVAAAYAKELLGCVQPTDVYGEWTIKEKLGEVLNTVSGIGMDVETIRSKLDKDEDSKILNWITPIDYGPKQSDLLRRRQPGTGEWFLESAEFRKWLETSGQTLFFQGIPGAGKTIITSIVVDDLYNRFDTTIGIGYVYLSFQREYEQGVDDLLASLLTQLAERQGFLPAIVKDLYDQRNAKRTRPSRDKITELLHAIAGTYSRVFIIIDALDECQVSDNCRAKFLSELFDLQTQKGVNIFATSRSIPDIVDRFKQSTSIEIRARPYDVARYIRGQMERLPFCIRENQQLREEVERVITEAVDGMFLLAQLYLAFLDDKTTSNNVRSALKAFQKQHRGSDEYQIVQVLGEAYKRAMERINRQKPGLKDLAFRVLSWIICAKRPLKTLELQHALATKAGKSELDQGDLPHIRDIVLVCAGLVTVDDESGIIRLVHCTAHAYLVQTQEQWFPGAQADITRSCITYLSFSVFESGFCQNDNEFEKRLRSYPFYDYAACNWGHHARMDPDSPLEVIKFLRSEARMEASSQAQMVFMCYAGYNQRGPTYRTNVHLAAFFGLDQAMETLLALGYSPDSKDAHGRTPLLWAVMCRHDGAVKLLLSKGANPEAADKSGETPLRWSLEHGYETITNRLLHKAINIESEDRTSWTPLSWAARHGHETNAKLLLEKGVGRDPTDYQGRTPLSHAAGKGHESVVRLLLESGANPNSQDCRGWSPLSWAVAFGHKAVVEVLLATNRIYLESKDKYGRTVLWNAVWGGNLAVFKLLLTKGASLHIRDEDDRTILCWAAIHGQDAIVKLLLEEGVDPNTKDELGLTPISFAAGCGHDEVVRLLLANEHVYPDSKDKWGGTPRMWAEVNGRDSIIQLLRERQAKADSEDELGFLPLVEATLEGKEAVIKLLFSKTAIEFTLRVFEDIYPDDPDITDLLLNKHPEWENFDAMRY